MRLINTSTLELEEYFGSSIPEIYAILSHTWFPNSDEVTFHDWVDAARRGGVKNKAGYRKILGAVEQARLDECGFLWVDTVCINKESSAELSEAINSMFAWYRDSRVCYVYLSDIISEADGTVDIQPSKWFTRGWTLQELVAPMHDVVFFDQFWQRLGTREDLVDEITKVTLINRKYIDGKKSDYRISKIHRAPIAEKMSWLASRVTTREEDIAYCAMGLFNINMPLLYGEGKMAFIRLQEEITKRSADHTLFCWSLSHHPLYGGMLAPHPKAFEHSGSYRPVKGPNCYLQSFAMTNIGLQIKLPLFRTTSGFFAILNAEFPDGHQVGIILGAHWANSAPDKPLGGTSHYAARQPFGLMKIPGSLAFLRDPEEVFVSQTFRVSRFLSLEYIRLLNGSYRGELATAGKAQEFWLFPVWTTTSTELTTQDSGRERTGPLDFPAQIFQGLPHRRHLLEPLNELGLGLWGTIVTLECQLKTADTESLVTRQVFVGVREVQGSARWFYYHLRPEQMDRWPDPDQIDSERGNAPSMQGKISVEVDLHQIRTGSRAVCMGLFVVSKR